MPGLTGEEVLRALSEGGRETWDLRLLVVAAHPDDEVIGFGGQLPLWPKSRFLHLTNGAPENMADATHAGFRSRMEYAEARRRELEKALSMAGISPGAMACFDITDQAASSHLVRLTRTLTDLIGEIQPDAILTHPFEGGHPDHDAACFCVHAAGQLFRTALPTLPILEMTSYHNRSGIMATGEFLPSPVVAEAKLELSAAQQAFKRQLFSCFETQGRVLSCFPIESERFRVAPVYDFTMPPHPGVLFYEQFDWGMTARRWCACAAQALVDLGIAEPGRADPDEACVSHCP